MKKNRKEKETPAEDKKYYLPLLFITILIAASAIIYLGMEADFFDLNDTEIRILDTVLIGGTSIILFSSTIIVILMIRPTNDEESRLFSLNGVSLEKAAETIRHEMDTGKILYKGSLECDTPANHNTQILLTPSYLLLIGHNTEKMKIVPFNQILWIGVQKGYEEETHHDRLILFTQMELLHCDVTDVEQAEQIAEDLYQYIPNVFCDLDWQEGSFPHRLEKLYQEDHDGFLALYEEAKEKQSLK